MKKIILREVPLFLLILFASIIYFSCDDSGVAPEDPTFCISGTITNWTQGTKTLEAYVQDASFSSYAIASAPIDAQGNFNICVPLNMPDSSLVLAESIFTAGCPGGTITFDPADVKGNVILMFKVMDGATQIGDIRKTNSDTLYPGAFSIMYLNTNKNTVATGQKICSADTLNFNVTAVSGWTKIARHCTKTSGTSVTYQFNNNEPAGANWKFY